MNINVTGERSDTNIVGSFCPFNIIGAVSGREMCDRCVIMYTHTHTHSSLKWLPIARCSPSPESEASLLCAHIVYACAIMRK